MLILVCVICPGLPPHVILSLQLQDQTWGGGGMGTRLLLILVSRQLLTVITHTTALGLEHEEWCLLSHRHGTQMG